MYVGVDVHFVMILGTKHPSADVILKINVENGVVKKAGESVENDGNMKRNEKRRLNRLKKKEEEKKK